MTNFVDTNVFVYAKDASEPQRQPLAGAWVQYCWSSNAGRTSVQVLSEYYVTVTRKLRMDIDSAQADIRSLLAWQPHQVDEHLIGAAWTVERRYGLSWWDSLIVAAAQQMGCERLLTEDLQHGQRYGDVVVVNPFIEPPPAT